ncbi:MAG: hypothetical protein LBL62_05380 [Planctomycetaceae bacterium]|nr:hypothetical protein [Planctomycetaceae bacterium]
MSGGGLIVFVSNLGLMVILKDGLLWHYFCSFPVLLIFQPRNYGFFMFSELITRFFRKSPISVMNRALLEHIFAPDHLNVILPCAAKSPVVVFVTCWSYAFGGL